MSIITLTIGDSVTTHDVVIATSNAICDTVRTRDSIKRTFTRRIRDTVTRSDSVVRRKGLRFGDTVRAPDLLTVDIKAKDFYSQYVLSKSFQKDIPFKFTLESLNNANNFYARLSIIDTALSNFYAKYSLATTKTRFTRNPLLIPGAPALSGAYGTFIEDPINITIAPLATSGANLNWSVAISTASTAVFSLEKLVVKMVGGIDAARETVVTLPKRQFIWDRKLKSYLAGQQFGSTYYNNLIATSGGRTFTGQFNNLPSGKHQIFVEAIQRGTGNRYLAASGFVYGTFPYTVHASGVPNYGIEPTTVNFTSARGDVSATATKRVVWYYDYESVSQWNNAASGRNTSFVYRQPNLYIPMVSYVMGDNVTVTEALTRVYREE